MASVHAIDVTRGNARASAEALTLDTLRAVRGLALTAAQLETILEADAELVSRLLASETKLSPDTEIGARALMLVRLHRALGDVFGSLELAHGWLDKPEPTLHACPADLIRSSEGLARTLAHLEGRCNDCLW